MKTYLAIILTCFTISVFGQTIADSLLLYYPFNGNVLDSSGNHYDGLSNAEFCADPYGVPGHAIHFNGFDQYLNFPASRPDLKPDLPISFAYWIMYDDVDLIKTFAFATDYDQDNYSGLYTNLTPYDQKVVISYGDNSDKTLPYNRRSGIGSTTIEPFTWYYIILIVRGPYDMEIYVNCNKEEVWYDGDGGPLAYTDCQGNLGRKDNDENPPFYFQGAFDEFRYWNKSLSQAQIDSLCTTVGVNDHPSIANEIILTPNPASSTIRILNMPETVRYIKVFDSAGRCSMKSSGKAELDVSSLSPGYYQVELEDGQHRPLQSLKFVKI